jgi:uncharacterized protein YbcI
VDEAQASPAGGESPLRGGHLLAAISNRIVQIQREHYGRGPMKAKRHALDDLVVVAMRGTGFTPLEKTMMDSGDPDRIVEMRREFQRIMTKRFTDTIEELTRRKVLAFLHKPTSSPTLRSRSSSSTGHSKGSVELVQPE